MKKTPPDKRVTTSVMILAVVSVSLGSIFIRLAEAPALVIATWRVTFAALIILPVVLLFDRRSLANLAWGKLACVSFFLALHFATWIQSLETTSVAVSTILVSTSLIWILLLDGLFLKRTPNKLAWISLLLATLGTIIIAGPGVTTDQSLQGVFLALLGGLSLAVYLWIGANLRQNLDARPYLALCYSAAAIWLWVFLLIGWQAEISRAAFGHSMKTWGYLVALAIISQVMGHGSYNWCLKYVASSVVAITLLTEPLIASLLAWLILSEGITFWTAVGGVPLLAGIYLSVMAKTEGEQSTIAT